MKRCRKNINFNLALTWCRTQVQGMTVSPKSVSFLGSHSKTVAPTVPTHQTEIPFVIDGVIGATKGDKMCIT